MNTPIKLILVLALIALFLPAASGYGQVGTRLEDFTSKQYCDTTQTTAAWDTTGLGGLGLAPFSVVPLSTMDTPGQAWRIAISGNHAFVADYAGGIWAFDITDPANPDTLGNLATGGNARGIEVSGDYAFLAVGYGGIQVIDITDPSNMQAIGSGYDTPSEAKGLDRAGNLIYISDAESLLVIDVMNPLLPVRLGGCDVPGIAQGVAVQGDYAFVAAHSAGLQVVDVSDPANPVLGLVHTTPDIALDVTLEGNMAFVTTRLAGLQIIDISNPGSSLPLVGSYDTQGEAESAFITGDFVYLSTSDSLIVLDIQNPASPVSLGGAALGGHGYDVWVSGEHAFVAEGSTGMTVFDIAQPVLPPVAIGDYPAAGNARSVAIAGDNAYLTNAEDGLLVFDISSPRNPIPVGTCATPGDALDVAVSGDRAYIADGEPAFLVVDITDPANPVRQGGYDWQSNWEESSGWDKTYRWPGERGPATDIFVQGDQAYLLDGPRGFWVFDIATDPATPDLIGPGGGHYIVGANRPVDSYKSGDAAGSHIYLADGTGGLRIFDVSSPDAPVHKFRYDTPGSATGVTILDNLAFVADAASGLLVLDISDPIVPTAFGTCDLPAIAIHVAASRPYAYVTTGHSGLQIVNYMQRELSLSGGAVTPASSEKIAVSGAYAYLADGLAGLSVMNIGNPAVPAFVDSLPLADDAADVAVAGSNVFVAAGTAGLQVVDASTPASLVWRSELALGGDAVGIDFADDQAFLVTGDSLIVIDVVDPDLPARVGAYSTAGTAHDVFVAGTTAYVADGDAGLLILDLTDPANPDSIGAFDTPGTALSVAVLDTLICVADSDSVLVLDVNPPETPTRVAAYATPGTARDIHINMGMAFVADDDAGVLILDLGDLDGGLQLVGELATSDRARGLTVDGLNMFVADNDSGLVVVDYSALTLVGDFTWKPWWNAELNAYDISLMGDSVAFVTDMADWHIQMGLVAIDISDPLNLSKLDYFLTPGTSEDVEIVGDKAFVADGVIGLHILDVSDPSDMTLLGTCETPGQAKAVDVRGDYAYIATDADGIWAVDISDPTRPAVVGAAGTSGRSRAVAVDGNQAYVVHEGRYWAGCNDNGMKVFDISNPDRPVLDATWSGWGSSVCGSTPHSVALDWPTAFIGDGDPVSGNFWTVDVGTYMDRVDVNWPEWWMADSLGALGRDTRPSHPRHLAIVGDHAFVADEHYGLLVYDISDLTKPTKIAERGAGDWRSCSTCGDCDDCDCSTYDLWSLGGILDVEVVGDYAFLVDQDDGLWVFNIATLDDPASICPYEKPVPLGDPWDIEISGDHAFIADNETGLHVFSVFSRRFDSDANVAQSLTVAEPDSPLVRCLLTTVGEADSIHWEVTANGDTLWQDVRSGVGATLAHPGTDLRWRSTHYDIGSGQNPSCTSLSLEYWLNCAVIDSIQDVPGDQGGWSRVFFTRSGYDFVDAPSPITNYYLWRQVNSTGKAASVLNLRPGAELSAERSVPDPELDLISRRLPGVEPLRVGEQIFVYSTHETSEKLPAGLWELVASVPGAQQEIYQVVVPTYLDLNEDSLGVDPDTLSIFCVSAHQESPVDWYVSLPDTGTSIDNTAPAASQKVSFLLPALVVWEACEDPDIVRYSVYGSSVAEFTEGANLIATTESLEMDVSGAPYPYYHVTATDWAGNEGPAAMVANPMLVNRPGFVPTVHALYQGVPNPFRGATAITFDLPQAEDVRLQVFDVQGRLVKDLFQGQMPPGQYQVDWRGDDRSGRRVAPGIYLYRLQAGQFMDTRKLTLVR